MKLYSYAYLRKVIDIFVSEFIKAGIKGHRNFDFVDVNLDDDTRLFIDPCMIEGAEDPWSVNAEKVMRTYFDCIFDGFYNGNVRSTSLLSHAGEQNATKLGYGNGDNGKGKTEDGLWDSLKGLATLIHDIPTINCAQDIPVLVEGFAEDGMSDLLTNILHEQLNHFTQAQMLKWGCAPQGEKSIWTFNAEKHSWIEVMRPCWLHRGKEILLVPKWIVRRNYLFKAHQYLYSIIVERMREANGWEDLKKIDVWNNLPRNSEHWEYETVIAYSKQYPEALSEYHDRMPHFYKRARGCMTDEDLDCTVYGFSITDAA